MNRPQPTLQKFAVRLAIEDVPRKGDISVSDLVIHAAGWEDIGAVRRYVDPDGKWIATLPLKGLRAGSSEPETNPETSHPTAATS